MPSFTSFLSLYKPGGGSSGLITPDEVADVDRFNANSDLIDAWAVKVGNETTRSFLYYGTTAAMGGALVPAPKDGDEYQESDGNKIRWKRVGGTWVTNVGGSYLVRPTSVSAGASIRADGSVDPGTTAALVQLNGVFTSRFRAYQIVADIRYTGGTNASFFQFTAGGAIHSAASYHYQSFVAANTSVSASQASGSTSATTVNVLSEEQALEFLIENPADPTRYTKWNSVSSAILGATGGVCHIAGAILVGTPMDGICLSLQVGGGGRAYNGGSISVYGLV